MSEYTREAWVKSLNGICSDCGHRPIWKWGYSDHLCRECYRQGGHYTYVEIDPDKIEALVGEEMTRKILEECRHE